MPEKPFRRRRDLLRDGSATITLRINDGMVTARVSQSHIGGTVGYAPILCDLISTGRVRKLLDSLLRQAKETSGGDVIYLQLELIERATDA